jgi:hypothetical protein
MARRLLVSDPMLLQLDTAQARILEEVLEVARRELMIESARTDSHDFREDLHTREDRIEEILAQMQAARNCHSWAPARQP